MSYVPPFRTRPNNRYPRELVTIEDANGSPMLTTHDEKIAVRVAELLTADMVGGLVFPGWTCPSCRAFNGAAKEILKECRGCGAARPS